MTPAAFYLTALLIAALVAASALLTRADRRVREMREEER